jgi:hypothetical protein
MSKSKTNGNQKTVFKAVVTLVVWVIKEVVEYLLKN